MTAWAAFLPYLLPHVKGVADPAAEQALRDAATDFFRRTRAWRRWLAEVPVQAGQREYVLPLPSGAQVVRIETATVGGASAAVHSFQGFPSDPALHAGQASGVASRDRVSVLLAGDASPGAALQVEATLTLTDAATGVEDAFFQQYRAEIVDGAKALLMLTPDQTFTNLQLGALASDRFETAIDREKVKAFRGQTNSTPRSRPVWC